MLDRNRGTGNREPGTGNREPGEPLEPLEPLEPGEPGEPLEPGEPGNRGTQAFSVSRVSRGTMLQNGRTRVQARSSWASRLTSRYRRVAHCSFRSTAKALARRRRLGSLASGSRCVRARSHWYCGAGGARLALRARRRRASPPTFHRARPPRGAPSPPGPASTPGSGTRTPLALERPRHRAALPSPRNHSSDKAMDLAGPSRFNGFCGSNGSRFPVPGSRFQRFPVPTVPTVPGSNGSRFQRFPVPTVSPGSNGSRFPVPPSSFGTCCDGGPASGDAVAD
jgi:hypothetical protein